MAFEGIKDRYVRRNNAFYRQYYSYFIIAMMLILFLMLLAAEVVLYQMQHRPLPLFYAQEKNNQSMTLQSSDEPNLLPETILRWSTKAATRAYTVDFSNYKAELEQAKPYFTDAGWVVFQSSVGSLIDRVVKGQLFVSGVVSGTPVISNQGPLPGKGFSWRVQIPFLVTYQSSNNVVKRNYYVVLTIIRVPTSVNPQGIGIDQFVMT